MADDLVVLLPPSEGKANGGRGRWRPASGTFGRRLGAQRGEVIEALARMALDERHLGVRGELLQRAIAATGAIVGGRAKALTASQRYTGVVWQHLDPMSLTDDQRRRILVPSALLGLVGGNDPVPDHRLKFDVRIDGIGRLDRFWRPHVTEAVRARTASAAPIVDLLPNEHRAAVDLVAIGRRRRRVITVTFTGTTGHDAKAVKGALTRHLLTHGLDAPFAWNGWSAHHLDDEIVVSRTS
jgi:cytoplasmic iron level regulating protein YaaA (DUF328/UPF0246 family)